MRAQGRVLQAILRCVDELSWHRGCQPSKLGAALVAILRPPVGARGADVTRVDIDMGEAEENAEPAHTTPPWWAPRRVSLRHSRRLAFVAFRALRRMRSTVVHEEQTLMRMRQRWLHRL